jgi:hypothetical protein
VTISYDVTVNEEQLADAISLFEFVGGNTSDAIRVAINKTTPKIKTLVSERIRSQVRLSATYVRGKLEIYKATRGKLTGAISTPSRGTLLTRFDTNALVAGSVAEDEGRVSWLTAPPTPPAGIKVKVKPSGASKAAPHIAPNKAFYMKLKGSGAIGIVSRRNFPGPSGGMIEVFYGPSLSQVFNEVRSEVLPEASEEYQRQLLDAMRYVLQKKYPLET